MFLSMCVSSSSYTRVSLSTCMREFADACRDCMCTLECVCVCVRERERERESVCVCPRVRVYLYVCMLVCASNCICVCLYARASVCFNGGCTCMRIRILRV